MKISSTVQRFAAVFVAIGALITVSGVADAATSERAGMTKAEYRALALRSEALNEQYRLGKWKAMPDGMMASEYRALMIRSAALNRKYGLGTSATAAARTSTGSSHGFAFSAFGIGAVAMFGAVLLAGGVIARSRYTRNATGIRAS
jgi:hypothetical protein